MFGLLAQARVAQIMDPRAAIKNELIFVGKDDFNAARVAAVPQMLGRWASNAAPDSPKFNRCSHKHRTRSKTKRHQTATGWRAAISPDPDNAQGSLQKLTKQSVNNIGSPPHRATNLLRPPVSRSQTWAENSFSSHFPVAKSFRDRFARIDQLAYGPFGLQRIFEPRRRPTGAHARPHSFFRNDAALAVENGQFSSGLIEAPVQVSELGWG